MKRQFIFIYLFLATFFIASMNAQEITGSWLLNHIREDDITKEQVELLTFKESGELLVRDIPFGTWKIHSTHKTLILDAGNISGTYNINTLTHNKLKLSIEKKELFFTKLDKNKVEQDNINSGLMGIWEITQPGQDSVQKLLRLSPHHSFSYFEEDAYSSSTTSGIWLFNKKEKQLILIGQPSQLRGISSIILKNKTNITLQNKSSTFFLTKKKQVTNIEHLTFSEDDFYSQEGEYLYENDINKLPWNNIYDRYTEALKINRLVYQFKKLHPDTQTFKTRFLQSLVTTDTLNQTFTIDNVFIQFDRFTVTEGVAFQEKSFDPYKPLYPCQADTFRVIGKETLRLPAGTFVCTVVEAFYQMDVRIKLYMIDDKPGVIAKLIKENPEEFGYYTIYELNQIIYNNK